MKRVFLSLLAAILLLGTSVGAWADTYTFSPVALPGIPSWAIAPTGINVQGGVFGIYYDDAFVARPFVFANGSLQNLPRPDEGQVFVWNMNARGTYVGSLAAGFQTFGLLMSQNGQKTVVQVPGSPQTFLLGINDSGVSVGSYLPSWNAQQRGFRWENGSITPLQLPWAVNGFVARDINASGDIVGTWWADVFGPRHGYLMTRKSVVSLDYPNSLTTGIAGINNSGQIVGGTTTDDHVFFDNGDGTFWDYEFSGDHGFVYKNGKYSLVDYPAPAGYALTYGGTYPWAINERGQVLVYVDAFYDDPITFDEVYVNGYFVASPNR